MLIRSTTTGLRDVRRGGQDGQSRGVNGGELEADGLTGRIPIETPPYATICRIDSAYPWMYAIANADICRVIPVTYIRPRPPLGCDWGSLYAVGKTQAKG